MLPILISGSSNDLFRSKLYNESSFVFTMFLSKSLGAILTADSLELMMWSYLIFPIDSRTWPIFSLTVSTDCIGATDDLSNKDFSSSSSISESGSELSNSSSSLPSYSSSKELISSILGAEQI